MWEKTLIVNDIKVIIFSYVYRYLYFFLNELLMTFVYFYLVVYFFLIYSYKLFIKGN